MKNIFKKGLVVLCATLFVTSVFATEAAKPAQAAKPVTTAHAVEHHVHCKKTHCKKNKAGKKVCKKACKVKHVVKKAEAATPAKKA